MRKGAPSVNPNGRSAVRLDAFYNQYSGHGTTDDVAMATRHFTRPVSEVEAIDLRRGNWLAKRIVELDAEDCFARGFTLKVSDADKKDVEALMTMLESACLSEKLVAAGQMEAAVGGAALFPVLDGAVGDLSEPLDDEPRILRISAIHLLESRELEPYTWYDDITHPKWRKPSSYRVCALSSGGTVKQTSTVIHESRLAIFYGAQVSNELQPGQRWGWGDSKYTAVKDVIETFGLSWGSAAAILRNFSERIIKVKDLRKILGDKKGAAALDAWLQKLNRYRSSLRGQMFDADDDIKTLMESTAGLSDLLSQLSQMVSAASGISMRRLFGVNGGGLGDSGNADQQNDHKLIANRQKMTYRAPLEFMIRLFMLSAESPFAGQEPDVWSVEFTPLEQQNEKEVSETRKTTAETDQIYVDMGIPAESILRSRFGGDTYSGETTVDWAEYDKQKKAAEDMADEQAKAEQDALKNPPPADDPNVDRPKADPEAE